MSEPVSASAHRVSEHTGNYRFALLSLTSLFFMWGFITCLNDILIPHLKAAFNLSYTEAMLIQFCFFGAYFVVSMPAGALIRKIGYQKGIVAGLLIASAGCLIFLPAAMLTQYWIFLLALFVLASGITILQVSANPYVAALGSDDSASRRLTLTQAFNSLGTTVAPWFGALLILSSATSANADSVMGPYLFLALCLAALAIIFYRIKLPRLTHIEADTQQNQEPHESAWRYPHLVLGAIAIFVYVGAEVSIGSFLVNFFGEAHIAGMEESEAAKYITYYWGGAMVGRFVGAAAMKKIDANIALAFNGVMITLLILLTVFMDGPVAMWSILAVGFFNSIMYPVIFSLALSQLGAATSQGSGILCSAIVGGAIVPLLHGMVADRVGLQLAFLLPLICYLYIIYYGISGWKPRSPKPNSDELTAEPSESV